MKTAIKILIGAVFALSACQLIVDPCDPQASLPYSKGDLVYEPHCSSKCCEFVVHETTEICHQMWCFSDCEWTMTHKSCY